MTVVYLDFVRDVEQMTNLLNKSNVSVIKYCIAGKFGRVKLPQICSFWMFGDKHFGKWIDKAIRL